jgi:aryl-alcohol dehydrogenase-like predicted oxidoreductase
MQQVRLGRTGLQVSRIAMGGYPFGGVNRANGWDPWSSEGRRTAIETVNHAIDQGITYIDTAPSYGDGNSESIIGEVMKTRRHEVVLATKVAWEGKSKKDVIESVEASLGRLQTDHLDLVQFHGGMYTPEEHDHIVGGGPLEALRELKARGVIGFIGLTAEEPWTARPFLSEPDIDVMQLAYNLIYQSAARHILNETKEADVGVVTMRTMTSGIFQRTAALLAPEWQDAHDIFQVCLEFVLGDSRVTAPIVGMRWPHEVDLNVQLVERFHSSVDLADMPRMTAHIYDAQDADARG